jgi:hypothetical protein
MGASASQPSIFTALQELAGIMFLRFPVPLRFWIGSLLILNMGGLALSDGPEVKIIAGAFNVGGLIMARIYQKKGFVKLLGLGHSLWLGMVPWIVLSVLPKYEGDAVMTNWFTVLVAVNSVSLVLDVMDVYRYYFNGETEPTLFWNQNPKKTV